VRRAAAQSLLGLLADGFALAPSAQTKLQAVLADEDSVVRKRAEQALRRAARKQR
jgi:hypothetical protein